MKYFNVTILYRNEDSYNFDESKLSVFAEDRAEAFKKAREYAVRMELNAYKVWAVQEAK